MKLTPISTDPVGWSRQVAGTKRRVFIAALVHLAFVAFGLGGTYWLLQKIDGFRDNRSLVLLALFWASWPMLIMGVYAPTLYLYATHRLLQMRAAGDAGGDKGSDENPTLWRYLTSYTRHNPTSLVILIACLTAALLTSLVFLGRALWRNYWWEMEAYGLAGMVATREAMTDFSKGRLRLRAVQGENEQLRYSGSNDGPFEIWIPHFYPSLGYPHRFSTERQVEFYNRKMRHMLDNPEEFSAKTTSLERDSFSFITTNTLLQDVARRLGAWSRVRGSGILYYQYDMRDGSAVLLAPEWPFQPSNRIIGVTFYKDTNAIKLAP